MVSVSQIVKHELSVKPMLQEALLEGIVNYAGLSEKLQPKIELALGKKVKITAIIMALRRYTETISQKVHVPKAFKLHSQIVMKTHLCDITLVKTPSALDKIRELHKLVAYERGDMLNIIQGNYEMTIVISQKYLTHVKELLKKEKILNIETELVSLMLSLSRDFLYTPGILALVTRKFSWENINVFENISTMTELIFIISEKDATRAYVAFQELLKE